MNWSYRFIRRCSPLTSTPKLISLKNRFCRNSRSLFGDWACVIVSVLLMAGFYICSLQTLTEWDNTSLPQTTLSFFVGTLFLSVCTLITISATVTGIGSLLLSQDMEIFLTTPITSRQILRGKLVEAALATSWMLGIFLVPPFLAVGSYWHASPGFYTFSALFFAAILWLSTTLGLIVALLLCSVLSAKTGKVILGIIFVLFLVLITTLSRPPEGSYRFTEMWAPTLDNNAHGISSYFLQGPYDIGNALRLLLDGHFTTLLSMTGAATVVSLILMEVLNWLYTRLHPRAFSHIHAPSAPKMLPSFASPRFVVPWINRPKYALIRRELFSFSRDMTQTVQLGMLLSICILYLFNMGRIEYPSHVGVTMLQAWDLMMVLLCILLSSLVTLSVCSRFVFPSISLENRTLWILQSAPLSSEEILRAKYQSWLIPSVVIGIFIFMSGGFALGLSPFLMGLLIAMGVLITRTLVVLAIGMGTRFAFFEWEHPTQLATTMGNLLFMACGVAVVGIQTSIAAMVFGTYYFLPDLFTSSLHLLLLIGVGLSALLVLHTLTAKVALRIGIHALDGLVQ